MTANLRLERRLLREGAAAVAGCDEVGRGAVSGPVTVGIVVVTESMRTPPRGIDDSKALTPRVRESLEPRIRLWAHDGAVGHAHAHEIDDVGIIAALRLAALRALAQLRAMPDIVILDGSHDWLSAGPASLVDAAESAEVPPVRTMVGADRTCTSVAAASIIAKTARDRIMVDAATGFPAYRWHVNKGYATPDHLAAIREHGSSDFHRRSWRLPEPNGR